MCGQGFANLAQQMNGLYSAEQKFQPLGSQALSHRRTKVQNLEEKKIAFWFDCNFSASKMQGKKI